MKTRTFASVGSMHPVLFFAVVYVLALALSIFVCSSLFYSCNASRTDRSPTVDSKTGSPGLPTATTVTMR